MSKKRIESEFISDMLDLAKTKYGWSPSELMDITGLRFKANEELMFEDARELYPCGVVFIPIGGTNEIVSNGVIELIKGKIYVKYIYSKYLIADPVSCEWAVIINKKQRV